MDFRLDHTDAQTSARAGRLETAHGPVKTPAFMPVGTLGSVKAVQPRELRDDIGAQVVLGNTYHLYLRPGLEVIEAAGGLHAFMQWSGPILTDSGGYQVFSLSDRREITEEGVRFRSHLDGSKHLFTPESVVDTQRALGSDVMMVLDECPPGDASEAYARQSNERTLRWAARSREQYEKTNSRYGQAQALFAIVQGVVYPEIRKESARRLVAMDFPGYAIGGLSVGETRDKMYDTVALTCPLLPAEKPRYLMGVGTPENLLESIARGVDLFDCVLPTRNGRHGRLFTTEGVVNIRNAKWKKDFSPLDPDLDGYASQNFSKAYVRHLAKRNEVLGLQLASLQNLSFYCWLMKEARRAIRDDRFTAWKAEIQPRMSRRL